MNKYRNQKVILDGIKFDSKKESMRYLQLKQLEKNGEISNLQMQVKYTLQDSFRKNGKSYREIYYKADFVYQKDSKTVVEDVKGMRTPEYKIKKKMFEKRYADLELIEI